MSLDICQVAYYVEDAEAAAIKMRQQFGCGPFHLSREIPLEWALYNDTSIEFVHTSAYGQWGDIMVELVQLNSQKFPLFNAFGIHHMATMVNDLEKAYLHYNDMGFPVSLKAMTTTGTEFAFLDARPVMGHLIEVYERSDALLGFYEYIRRAANPKSDQMFL